MFLKEELLGVFLGRFSPSLEPVQHSGHGSVDFFMTI